MITWYMSGEPKSLVEYRLGRKEGLAYDWKESGDVISETQYHNGVAVKK
jgi:antitoxin component YwqK of YwqJK toxin-antitoxin module